MKILHYNIYYLACRSLLSFVIPPVLNYVVKCFLSHDLSYRWYQCYLLYQAVFDLSPDRRFCLYRNLKMSAQSQGRTFSQSIVRWKSSFASQQTVTPNIWARIICLPAYVPDWQTEKNVFPKRRYQTRTTREAGSFALFLLQSPNISARNWPQECH